MGSSERHLKVTVLRGINVNACTSRLFSIKSRTVVTVKASLRNLVYTTSGVVDMGQNPVWEEDGTNVFHFKFSDGDECIILKLFNRNNDCIGESKLLFSELNQKSEIKSLRVMENSQKEYGQLVVAAEILEEQTMGDRGLLTVKIRKGLIKNITSIFGARTTRIRAKLIYKHTTYTSGVLENAGNRFVWHEDNAFTFIINSDLQANDKLKVEVYNTQNKVGECDILVSLFVELEENLRRDTSAWVPHSTELCLPNKGAVGNIEVSASFNPKLDHRRNSVPQPSPQPRNPFSHHSHGFPLPGPARSHAPLPPAFGESRPSLIPSAPELYPVVENGYTRRPTPATGLIAEDQTPHGAPAGSRAEVNQLSEQDVWMIEQFKQVYH